MLNFTEHLRRLRVDKYEYVAMKVIVLLTSGKSAQFVLVCVCGRGVGGCYTAFSKNEKQSEMTTDMGQLK
jgi:hypothetical protein